MTLEEKIKALMETAQGELAEKVTVTDKDGDKMSMGDKDQDDEDQEEDQDDEDQDDDETEFSNEKESKKNTAVVKEDASNEMLKAGLSKKDPMGKSLAQPPQGGASQDGGKNAKLKVGLGRKDGKTGGIGQAASQNDENKEAFVDQQSLQVKPFKITVGESMDALFQGEELSEEFQSKAATIFESAVNALVEQQMVELTEEYNQILEESARLVEEQLDEAIEKVQDDLVESVNEFINYAVNQWVDDNQVALESGIKVEMVTNFIDGLKTLFQENYVEVPEDKLDIVEEQAIQIAKLEEALGLIVTDHDELIEELVQLKKHSINESVAKNLTLMQKEKFNTLCESLEYTSDADYEAKTKTIKESYFTDGKVKESQTVQPEVAPTQLTEDTSVSKYAAALGGQLRFKK